MPLGQGAADYFAAIDEEANSGPAFNLPGPNDTPFSPNTPLCTNVQTHPVQTHPAPLIKPDSTDPYLNIGLNLGVLMGVTFGVMIDKDGVFAYAGGGFMSSPGVTFTTSTTGITTGLNYNIELGVGGGGSINGVIAPGSRTGYEGGLVTPGVSFTESWVWKLVNPTKK